ncbi:hypothetical protein QR510_31330, partial [Escherichia coli]|uniref:hypothetical protein n=1 Tax=Escherichia coli TaxID=562 RepID=UPI0027382CB3
FALFNILNSQIKDERADLQSVDPFGFSSWFVSGFICELRLPDHRFRWKHNKLFLLLPKGVKLQLLKAKTTPPMITLL